jgi:hypothetical protein
MKNDNYDDDDLIAPSSYRWRPPTSQYWPVDRPIYLDKLLWLRYYLIDMNMAIRSLLFFHLKTFSFSLKKLLFLGSLLNNNNNNNNNDTNLFLAFSYLFSICCCMFIIFRHFYPHNNHINSEMMMMMMMMNEWMNENEI